MSTEKPKGESRRSGYFYNSTRYLAVFSAFCVMLLMLYITADVIGRYLFNRPVPNSLAVSETLMVFLSFLGLAYVQANKKNIRLDFLADRFGVLGSAILEVFSTFLALAVIGLFIWASSTWVWESWVIKDSMQGSFLIPFYYSKTAMFVGLIFLFIQLVIDFAKGIGGLRKIEKPKAIMGEN